VQRADEVARHWDVYVVISNFVAALLFAVIIIVIVLAAILTLFALLARGVSLRLLYPPQYQPKKTEQNF
jgi:hypothetical protein